MPKRHRILIADDEENIRTLLQYNLESAGFECVVACDGLDAVHMAQSQCPDLIILDWMMPELSGNAVCKELQQSQDTAHIPIIMLTARAEEVDVIKGLNSGACDYVKKPFSPQELIARVQATLRREQKQHITGEIHFNALTINPQTREVTYQNTPLKLSKKEFKLLQLFMENPKKIFSREALLNRIWGMETDVDERTVDVYIKRLRKSLGKAGELICTIRGEGYCIQ